jgi:hypothetical protein
MRGKNGLSLQKVNKYCLSQEGIMTEPVLTKEAQEIFDNVLIIGLMEAYPLRGEQRLYG